MGFLWNGQDKPPHSDINPSVRRLRTVSGHTIEFDDNGGKEKILIKTSGGHSIEMEDAALPKITVKTKGGQEVTLNDAPVGSVTAKTKIGNCIEITDTPPGLINISTRTGVINLDCLSANINAKVSLTVSAPSVSFGGVIQASSIIAGSGQFGAVVSGAYNPGVPGNLTIL